MKVVWSRRSQAHLQALFEYVALHDEKTAQKLVVRIIELSETILSQHPQSGRVGRVLNTYELVISKTPYVLAYKIKKNTVSIVAVWHSARQWPDQF